MNILYINALYNRQEDKNFSIVAIGGKNYVLEQVPKVRESVSSYLKPTYSAALVLFALTASYNLLCNGAFMYIPHLFVASIYP